MNTKNTSKRKSVDQHKIKSKNTEAEVFVLPPNLLEKLGIKLDKISSTENHSTHSKNISDGPVNNSENHQGDIEETYYVNTDKPIAFKSGSSILETASLMKESVLLSPTFVHTIANVIPGEVEIASVHKKFQNDKGNSIHGKVNIESYPVSLNSNQELLINFESGNTTQSDPLRNLQVQDKCVSEIKDNCIYNEMPNSRVCVDTDSIQNKLESQQYLIRESQNIGLKSNENQENSKNKISILNDEIIDIAKINMFISYKNNNVLTPVTAGMLLPPTKAYSNILDLHGLKVPKSGSNQLHGKDTNFMENEQCEYVEQAVNDIDANNTDTDVTQLLSKSNSGYDETSMEATVYEKGQFKDIQLCVNIPNSKDASNKNLRIPATQLNNDTVTGSKNISIVNNCLGNIQDINSQDCPVFVKLAMSSEISIDNQQNMSTDLEVKSQINVSFLDKKDVEDWNESCNSMTKENICCVEKNTHGCNVETSSTSAPNILSCNKNDTRNDSENSMKKSKLSIQGVEKPGGRSTSKNLMANMHCNREKVNKPKPDTKNKKQTLDKVPQTNQPVEYPQENLQVMKSLKTYQRKDKCNTLTKNSKNETNLITKMYEVPENQIQDIVIDTVCKSAEYCLCSDFGQLSYYDDDFYEHIHFWQHHNVACELDSILSIYVDNNIAINKYDDETTVEIFNETPEESSHKICWNEIYDDKEEVRKNFDKVNTSIVAKQLRLGTIEIKENDKQVVKSPESIDVEMLEADNNNIIGKANESSKSENWPLPNSSSHTNKLKKANKDEANIVRDLNKIGNVNKVTDANKVADVKKTGGASNISDAKKVEDVNTKIGIKRKRSIRVSKEKEECSLDSTEPSSKRDVKCGVCGQIFAKREWEEHSNKEHGCIAWEAGDIFDIEDKKVFKQIKQKLKDDGVLKCTFCNLNSNSCAEFILHVKECMNNKMSCSSHFNTSTSSTIIKQQKITNLSKSVKCGVCGHIVKSSDWIVHIHQEHNYIAWKTGETTLDNFTVADSSKKMKINAANTLPSSKEKIVKCYGSSKRVKDNTVTPSLEQSTVNCTSKKSNIETGITLTSPVKKQFSTHRSHEKTDSSIGSTTTPSDRKEISLMPVDSCKILNIDTATISTPLVKGKTVRHGDSHETINNEITSTHFVKDKSLRCGDSLKKTDIETESPSIKSIKHGSHSKINVKNKANSSLVKEKTLLSGEDDYPKDDINTSVKEEAVKSRKSSKEIYINSPSTTSNKEKALKSKKSSKEMDINIPSTSSNNEKAVKTRKSSKEMDIDSPSTSSNKEKAERNRRSSKEMEIDSHSTTSNNEKAVKTRKSSKEMDIDSPSTSSYSEEAVKSRKSSKGIDIDNHSTSPNKETAVKSIKSFKEMDIDSPSTSLNKYAIVKCGVCKQEIKDNLWIDHAQKAHNYLAWKEGEITLDLQDKDQIWQHLHSISKRYDGLVCSKCGLNRKYVKAYLSHIKECDEMDDPTEADMSQISHNKDIDTANTFTPPVDEENVKCDSSQKVKHSPMKADNSSTTTITSFAEKEAIKCGVCKQEIEYSLWNDHIKEAHNYLAWKEGESSLDLEDKDQIWQHLHSISKKCDGLVCSKCGLNRKYVKAYLNHIKQCDGTDDPTEANLSKNSDMDITSTSTPPVKEKNTKRVDFTVEVNTGSTLTRSDNEKSEKCWEVPIKVENDAEHPLNLLPEEVAVKCGVCKQEMESRFWNDHVHKVHNYLAWKEGESSLDLQDKDQVWQYLNSISKRCDGLVCCKCGLNRKYVKAYLNHIQQCDGTAPNNNSISSSMDISCISEDNTSQSENVELFVEIKCGVCSKTCLNKDWIMHIQSEHDYLAWKEGERQLNLQDQEEIENHLRSIIKKYGSLFCRNCGIERKYGTRAISKYLQHVDTCTNYVDTETEDRKPILDSFGNVVVKCGVCEQDIEDSHWIEHVENEHNYLAWKHGEKALDLEDTESVKLHFARLSKQVDAFKCAKCGFRKKYPKLYLKHIDICEATGSIDASKLNDSGMAECGVCSEQMEPKKWKSHAMEKHYNVAWRVGDHPIDLKSPYVAERYLKEYKQEVGELVCKVCGISRVSPVGFYAHIVLCGKSEEELEKFQNVCEICNKVYVCVYKNQHMTAHREQEYAKERKMQLLEKLNEENETPTETLDTTKDENYPVGRRRAAVKARGVIEKLKIEEDDYKTCATCGFEATTAKKLANHKCVIMTFNSGSETDDSYESEELLESDGSNVDAEVTEEEEEEKENASKKKSHKESIVAAKVPNLPFKYNKQNSYQKQSDQDFFQIHFTDEILFPEWLDCKYEQLEDSQLANYLPKMEQSCKIKIDDKWDSFNRFQVKKHAKGCSMFVGGTVKCLSWIPPRLNEDDQSGNYLAVSCHRDADTPRYNFDELSIHSGVIQIWDFGTLSSTLPKLVLCIAHDFGTVWAMDWCPSGAREINSSDNKCRLGLLAVACSNGFVYILSVPYPSSIAESNKMFFKLNPVAELRMSMSSERKLFQATAVSWSKQKGHANVIVGYADGTTALYDLCSTTPLLKCIENGVPVFYPYHDRRDHNVCITDVDICPSADPGRGGLAGAFCSTSMGGSAALLQPRAGQPRLDGRSPATVCKFTPGWPSVLVAPDDSIATQSPNELDWYGCGRRLGPICALCGCPHCGRVLVYTRPLLRYIDALPPYSDVKKMTVAVIKTTPLSKKRKIKNDELAMLVEPLTYNDVITQYGVEVIVPDIHDRNSSSSMREPFTERFPLSDVASLALCRAARHHRLAAVGLHAGFVLLLTV